MSTAPVAHHQPHYTHAHPLLFFRFRAYVCVSCRTSWRGVRLYRLWYLAATTATGTRSLIAAAGTGSRGSTATDTNGDRPQRSKWRWHGKRGPNGGAIR